MTGRIAQIQRFCTHDGPGIRTTAFLTGCPLRCAWCHNPECSLYADSVRNPASPLASRYVMGEDLVREMCRDIPFYGARGGVTLSGGEPLSQSSFAKEVLLLCRQAGVHTAVETSLCAHWNTIAALLPCVELWIVDIKCLEPQKHIHYTGEPNEEILANLRRLSDAAPHIWVRMPIVPGVQEEEDVRTLSCLLADMPSVKAVELIPFHLLGREKYASLGVPCPYPSDIEPGEEHMRALEAILRDAGLPVRTQQKEINNDDEDYT